MTDKRIIGNGPNIPWHIPEDFKLFKKLTSGHVVIMGSTTYKSIGKALPNRENFVLSSRISELPDAHVFSSFEAGLEAAKEWANANDKNVFIIGGASIYSEGLEHSDKLFLSHVKEDYEGDILFPEVQWNDWEIEEENEYKDFVFRSYKRR